MPATPGEAQLEFTIGELGSFIFTVKVRHGRGQQAVQAAEQCTNGNGAGTCPCYPRSTCATWPCSCRTRWGEALMTQAWQRRPSTRRRSRRSFSTTAGFPFATRRHAPLGCRQAVVACAVLPP